MAQQTVRAPSLLARRTGALLACGAVAGPVYVAVTTAQALTRDGFDLAQHPFNALTTGDLGWIQRANLALAGVLTVLFAVGMARVLRSGRGAHSGPRLLGLYGAGLIVGGVFPADPVPGFPPGTPELEPASCHGILHIASRGSGYVLLIAASLVIAAWFAAEGRRGWAWFSGAAVPMVFAAQAVIITTGAGTPTSHLTFLLPLALTWAWMTALAVHLHRRISEKRPDPVPEAADKGIREAPTTNRRCTTTGSLN